MGPGASPAPSVVRRDSMIRKVRTVLAAAALTTFLLPAIAQQAPPAGGPRPGGGGGMGFTHPAAADWNDHTGWQSLFDGKTLTGWDYSPDYWSVEDGAIVGRATPAKPVGTTNIIWRGGEPANFRIRFEWKFEGAAANGGFQYRGQNKPLVQPRHRSGSPGCHDTGDACTHGSDRRPAQEGTRSGTCGATRRTSTRPTAFTGPTV